jgi:ABC-type cobalamin/Fe3+-siderophores transport system ATPase subunit
LEISDRSLVMFPDKQTLYGPSSEVLTPETLTRSFGVNVKIVDINVKERPQYACVVAVN